MAQPSNGVNFAEFHTLGDALRIHARDRGDRIAFSFEGRDTSFRSFDEHVDRVANALLAEGLRPGDRISYLGKNSDLYFELFLGATRAGVVMAPVGWRLAPPEISAILDDAGSKLLFVGEELVETVRASEVLLGKGRRFLAMADGAPWPAYPAWRDARPATPPPVAVDAGDVAVQLYTSGTTGKPKGVMLTHHNLLEGRRSTMARPMPWNEWTPDDISLIAMPVGHVGGTGWGIVGLVNGCKSVVAREFDPFRVLDYLEHDGVSKLFMVPAALAIVVRQPRAREVDYRRLKYMLYGASPIPLDLLREAMDVFGCGFCQQYGLTETTGTIVYLPPEDHDPAGNPRMCSAGLPLPGIELKILDAEGNELETGQTGEVAVRGYSVMAGYWNRPGETAATLSEDGWLRTGDAGYLDEDGYLFIQDRVKDMIVSGAENIYPAEVESAIYGHPAVAEVAVIGVPDDKWGEAVKAIVVPKPGAEIDAADVLAADILAADVLAYARQRIAGYKVPKSVDFAASLPRNPAGKILRRQLREPYWAGRDRRIH